MSANQGQSQTGSNEAPNNQTGAGDTTGAQQATSDNAGAQNAGSTGVQLARYVNGPTYLDPWTTYSSGQHQNN